MTTKQVKQDEHLEDPKALLELALIQEYLREKGHLLEDLKSLPAKEAEKLMKDASQYASLKMEEVKARANFINELHDDASALEK
ncbi:MAG: hypothetical protein KA473_10085 [Anaerolineales bacterium]|nr:hypothetical protein [Anaerolineales bacterium]MBP6209780.1 hypothetical protein [Anaerolineales bacterium]